MSSRVNEANGENLQDPPIKNPGYANGLQASIQGRMLLTYIGLSYINFLATRHTLL